MTVYPTPVESQLRGQFHVHLIATTNSLTVRAYPVTVTDTGGFEVVDTATVSVQLPAVADYEARLTFSSQSVPSDLPHDVGQAVDAVIAQARNIQARGQ